MDDPRGSLRRGGGNGALHTYLHDHAAGARHALEMLRALRADAVDSPAGVFANERVGEIEEDLRVLEGLATQVGAEGLQAKEMAGWVADKLSRIKLSPLGEPFHAFEAVEFLSLGILGKHALWRVLATIAPFEPRLGGVDFEFLMQRADAQYAAIETVRLRLATQVFL